MKIKSYLSAIFLFVITASVLFGQHHPLKIGYTNPEYILSLLPEYKQVESELKTYEKQLQAQLDNKLKEYQTKLDAYQKDMATLPDVVKQDKEKELISMQGNIKEFEESAMGSMQKKQGQLLDPIWDKIQKAIDEVAKENGYTYIFNSSAGTNAIILFSKNEDENISDLVLKKLGVTPPAKSTGTTGATPNTGNTGTNTTAPINPNTGINSGAPVKKK